MLRCKKNIGTFLNGTEGRIVKATLHSIRAAAAVSNEKFYLVKCESLCCLNLIPVIEEHLSAWFRFNSILMIFFSKHVVRGEEKETSHNSYGELSSKNKA